MAPATPSSGSASRAQQLGAVAPLILIITARRSSELEKPLPAADVELVAAQDNNRRRPVRAVALWLSGALAVGALVAATAWSAGEARFANCLAEAHLAAKHPAAPVGEPASARAFRASLSYQDNEAAAAQRELTLAAHCSRLP
jgi:hypothetical protein